jgi:hypothetical protein
MAGLGNCWATVDGVRLLGHYTQASSAARHSDMLLAGNRPTLLVARTDLHMGNNPALDRASLGVGAEVTIGRDAYTVAAIDRQDPGLVLLSLQWADPATAAD